MGNFYISVDGDDGWSGTIPIPNDSRTDGPFRTFTRARDAMRASKVRTTFVRGGTYRFHAPLVLDQRDNGVTFSSMGEELPVICGSEVVSRFTRETWDTFSSQVAGDSLEVFLSGDPLRPAVYGPSTPDDPTSGFLIANSDGTKSQVRITPNTVRQSDIRIGNWIQVFDRERLTDELGRVTDFDTALGTIDFDRSLQYPVRKGGTIKLMGDATWIRNPGEFGWRQWDGRLVVRVNFPDLFDQSLLTVARTPTLFKLYGAVDVSLCGFEFRECSTGGGAAVWIEGGGDHTITNNTFNFVGEAVRVRNSVGNDIDHNTLVGMGENGIYLDGGSSMTNVAHNDISRVGTLRKGGTAIGGNGVHDNMIANNAIADCARYGISLKDWGPNPNFSNTIQYNTVARTCLETADGGGIEMLGRSLQDTKTLIQGNMVTSTVGLATTESGDWLHSYKGFGIYLDDGTSGVTVTLNFLSDLDCAIYVHGGNNNTIQNNFAVLIGEAQDFIKLEYIAVTGKQPMGTNVTKNVIYGKTFMKNYWNINRSTNHVIGSNLIYNSLPFYSGPTTTDVRADPLFVDFANGNLKLSPNSPAFGMGIVDLPWEKMGPV